MYQIKNGKMIKYCSKCVRAYEVCKSKDYILHVFVTRIRVVLGFQPVTSDIVHRLTDH